MLMKFAKSGTGTTPNFSYRGVTLIELVVSLAVMAVALAFTAPAMKGVAARADVKVAAENVSQAFRVAKNTARATGRPVTVTISKDTSGNSITFTDDGGNAFVRTDASGISLPAISLPDKISVTAAKVAFKFDSMGMIVGFQQKSTIVLTSTVLSSHVMTVSIVNRMGYVTIVKGLIS